MTYHIDDLIEQSFQLSYHTGIQPSELDKLTTYEIRNYIRHLNIILESESKKDSSLLGAFSGLFAPKIGNSKAPTRRRK